MGAVTVQRAPGGRRRKKGQSSHPLVSSRQASVQRRVGHAGVGAGKDAQEQGRGVGTKRTLQASSSKLRAGVETEQRRCSDLTER